MNIGILGAGPAGMFAAHAAVQLGHQIDILSKPRKSLMHGAQYLHRPIPGLSGDPFKIDYRLDGEAAGYRDKVYGPYSTVDVSPETLTGVHDAWDIREAYDAAYDLYKGDITPWSLEGFGELGFNELEYDLVISTVPAHLLCSKGGEHEFFAQRVWSTDFVKRIGAFEDDSADNIVVCSGYPDDWWYRASRIHGWENTEYPFEFRPKVNTKVWEVNKPISTTCDCHGEIHRLGRYGKWTKGVLSDSAYYDAESIIIQQLGAMIP